MRLPTLPRLLLSLLLLLLLAATAPARAGNDYPLVLVHGFMGWGRDELLGFKYWGGFEDVQDALNRAGHQTYTGVVGPFASNWDRACELYAFIQGGTVDYGQAHAAAHGHARRGRTFPGLYPNWGKVDERGQLRKIHLIGHSQGGQTARVLTALLGQGAPAEIAATPAAELSPLFRGGHAWVRSVTTLASPHDGTSLAMGIERLLPFARDALLGFAALAGIQPDELPYDFKLDQWGLRRWSGETFPRVPATDRTEPDLAIARHQRLGSQPRRRAGVEPALPGPAGGVLFFLGDLGDRAGLAVRAPDPPPHPAAAALGQRAVHRRLHSRRTGPRRHRRHLVGK